jgi:hypothetical protein
LPRHLLFPLFPLALLRLPARLLLASLLLLVLARLFLAALVLLLLTVLVSVLVAHDYSLLGWHIPIDVLSTRLFHGFGEDSVR